MRPSTAELFLKLREKLGEDTAKVLTDYLEEVKEELTSKFMTREESIQWFEALKAEINALRSEIKALEEKMDAKYSALEEKMDAKYSVLEERIKAVEAQVKALEEKMKAFQDMMNERYQRLEERLDHKIDRTNLLLFFLIILSILGMTLFNPNFISIIKMLL